MPVSGLIEWLLIGCWAFLLGSVWSFVPFYGWLGITGLFALVGVVCEMRERFLRAKKN